MNKKYKKSVQWSDEDNVFIGSLHKSDLATPECCHGHNEVKVFKELCEIEQEWNEIETNGLREEYPHHKHKNFIHGDGIKATLSGDSDYAFKYQEKHATKAKLIIKRDKKYMNNYDFNSGDLLLPMVNAFSQQTRKKTRLSSS
ncbi:MAG: hypothetical protein DRQ51_04710 [Gammaproteobacteria bacterium]|nr:MAG: hypothetical protein DRQ51_04710 [Gammaproteobacteria bacterium]